MPPRWHRLRVAAELPGQAGGIARVVLLPSPPPDEFALDADGETCCLLWPGVHGPEVRCLQRGRPIQLCGHGLLAAAHFWIGRQGDDSAAFSAGDYHVTATVDGALTWLRLTRPSCRPEPLSAFARGVCPGEPAIDAATAGGGDGYRILAWPPGTDLQRLRPDVATIRDFDSRALIITAAQGEGQVALRYFAPQYGNDEDAATGSACVVLADYWQRRSGGDRWRMLQQSAAGALFHVRASGERVRIGAICAALGPAQK